MTHPEARTEQPKQEFKIGAEANATIEFFQQRLFQNPHFVLAAAKEKLGLIPETEFSPDDKSFFILHFSGGESRGNFTHHLSFSRTEVVPLLRPTGEQILDKNGQPLFIEHVERFDVHSDIPRIVEQDTRDTSEKTIPHDLTGSIHYDNNYDRPNRPGITHFDARNSRLAIQKGLELLEKSFPQTAIEAAEGEGETG